MFLVQGPSLQSARAQRDALLGPAMHRVWAATTRRYGVREAWKQLRSERLIVARCTVTRLFRALGLQSVARGRHVRTTIPQPLAQRPDDLVQRNFTATRQNQLWVSDLTFVSTWRDFVYVAFVMDASSRRIVDWRATTTLWPDLALGALEQALYYLALDSPLVHQSDRGAQYLAIRYTDRLLDACIVASMGSRGDYDYAFAETIKGLCKAEMIPHPRPRKELADIEHATLEWVPRYNTQRLMEPSGNIPKAQCEAQ